MIINKLNNIPDFYIKGGISFINEKSTGLPKYLKEGDKAFVKNQIEIEKSIIQIVHNQHVSYLIVIKDNQDLEYYRKKGNEMFALLKSNKETVLSIDGSSINQFELMAFAEGVCLSSYQFIKYFKTNEQNKKKHTITELNLYNSEITDTQVKNLNHLVKAVFWARNMVNEPANALNATKFSDEVVLLGKESGFSVEVLDKKKIEALKMGGLLAVNKGSIDPPTFTICEWKPKNAKNKKPYVLVGKGVMFDTGGLSLKPTANSMDLMKSDMGGAAAVAATIYAISLCKNPVWVIGLLPATDNRPDGNAYAPGDIIKMYNGLHVEVMNTDAEGRMILADALSYADKYKPELVIDMATLTGSAVMAIGKYASICMGNAGDAYFEKLKTAGNNTHERLVQFPFWDDYKESIKSPVADIKNIGEREAGAISAGKFLEHFTKSPYIHIDIAGTGFLSSDDSYRLKGGTGVGVRLLAGFFDIVSNQA